MVLNREQEIALAELKAWLKSKDMSPRGLIGRAGTGKTTLLQYLDLPVSTIGVAPTLQAVGILANSLDCACTSFSSFTFGTKVYNKDKSEFVSDKSKWHKAKRHGLIIIDEASMLSEKDVKLLHEIYPKQKILFVGDIGQLPSIEDEEYSVFNDIICYLLLKNERSGVNNPVLTIANNNYLSENINIDDRDNIFEGKGYKYIKLKDINDLFIEGELDTVCVATNRIRNNINSEIHNLLFPGTNYGVGEILISNENIEYLGKEKTKNRKYRITNSELIKVIDTTQISTKLTVDKLSVDVLFDRIITDRGIVNVLNAQYQNTYNKFVQDIRGLCMLKKLDWDEYHKYKEYFHDISYSYAITVHKAQGSGFRNVAVYYNDIKKFFNSNIKVNLFYTAVTRTRNICYIIVD